MSDSNDARRWLTNPDGINLQPTDKLHCFLRHVARSGLRRVYDVYIVRGQELVRITHSVAAVCGYRYDTMKQGLIVDGHGFSAACDIAHALSRALFPHVKFQSGSMPYHDHM